MEHTWKSHLNRRTMAYLHPNPFYHGVARMLLLDQKVLCERLSGWVCTAHTKYRLDEGCPSSHYQKTNVLNANSSFWRDGDRLNPGSLGVL